MQVKGQIVRVRRALSYWEAEGSVWRYRYAGQGSNSKS